MTKLYILILMMLNTILVFYIGIYVFYLVILSLLNCLIKDKSEITNSQSKKFIILIPAHNESLLLPRLLQSINSQNYPPEYYKTIVVADNCIDDTAAVAKRYSAIVLERYHSKKVGKGYALQYGIKRIDLDQYDALIIVDGDCVFDKNALLGFDQELRSGKKNIQAYSALVNSDESWLTRLLTVSHAVSNEIFLPSKRKLGLSVPLMGTGMCFCKETVLKYGWDAFSVGEDWEFYAKLITEGELISFAKNARIYHQESSSLKQATSQRMRWASGKFAIAWKYGFRLFYTGLVEKNIVKLEGSLPLLFPNPSLGLNITIMGLILSLYIWKMDNSALFFVGFSVFLFIQIAFFLTGILYTQNKLKNFLSLFVVPVFLIWKMIIDILCAMGMGRESWVRTERKL